jgi:hypothetical protein
MATTGPKGAAPTSTERGDAEAAKASVLLSSAGNMEKVRDILFGAQMREFEKRLLRMEEKQSKEQSDFREDSRRRFEALEQFVRNEIESLAAGLRAEQKEREDSARGSEKMLLDALKAAERKLGQVEEQLAKTQRELRQQQHEQQSGLREELRTTRDQLGQTLSRHVEDLRTEKLDRASLAGMLSEVAMRLTGELPAADRR